MTESQLIDACIKGAPYAQQLLYERFCDPLFIVCIRYIPAQADAEEILSDTFIRAFRSLHQFENRGKGSFQAWITRIAVNECLQFLRKQKTLRFLPSDQPVMEQADGHINAQDLLQAKDLLHMIHHMPDGYRTVFNLYVIDGYNHKEISRLLGISENTSKTQLMKAKTFLRGKLESDGKRI